MAIVLNEAPPKQRSFDANELVDHNIMPNSYFGTTISESGYVWYFDGVLAARVGIQNPDHLSKVTLLPGQTLREALSTLPMFFGKEFTLHQMTLAPGAYYPHIARPSGQHPLASPGTSGGRVDENSLTGSLVQMRLLIEMLDSIFRTIDPVDENLKCFGHTIRNLIILACTECETHWRTIMIANGYIKPKNTADYVKILPAMRLSEYQVSLQYCPRLRSTTPFRDWSKHNPTRSLAWYDAYNAAKHDRTTSFKRATLEVALHAVVAVWIMIAAQYGVQGMRKFSDLSRYFRLEHVPLWRYSDVYTHGYAGHHAHAGPHHFPF